MSKYISFLPLLLLAFTSCNRDKTEYDASGIFEITEVVVSAQTPGEIVRFAADEGMRLARGQEVALIDTVQLALKRRQLAAGLSSTASRRLDEKRQVAAFEQQIANLRTERARFAALVSEKAATQKQVDDFDHQIEVVERQLSAAREQVASQNESLDGQGESILAQIALIDDQIRRSHIASPIEGVVLTKYAEAGELASAGKPLFKVGDTRHIKLRAYLTAPQMTHLRLGQKVTVYADLDAADRKAYQGTVVWMSDKAEFTPKTIQTRDERANLVYAVKIAVENDDTIKQGMYGEVKL